MCIHIHKHMTEAEKEKRMFGVVVGESCWLPARAFEFVRKLVSMLDYFHFVIFNN